MDDAATTSGVTVAEPVGAGEGLVCIRCGYSLTGLEARRPCPECGLLAGFSLLDGHELRHNRPRWLVTLSAGATLVALATLLLPTLGPTSLMFNEASAATPPGIGITDWGLWSIAVVCAAPVTLGLLAGTWLMTRWPGAQRIQHTSRSTRIWLIVLAIVPLLYMSLFAGVSAGWLSGPWIDFAYSTATSVATLLSMAAYYASLFWHLKSLAARAPAPMLAADSPIVGTVLAACVAVSIVLGFLIARDPWAYGIWMDVVRISLSIVLSIGLTAGIWSVYLLIRYAIAFASSARQARRLMEQFDASRNPAPLAYHPQP